MTTQLSTYQRMPDPLAAMKEIGAAIAKSQMFGCETESQGQVLALHCMATGRDPLTICESYHLMHGRLTLKAEEMLARLVDDGGQYEIVEHSPEAAEIVLRYRGRTFRERFTFEEARLEPFVYSGKPKDIMPLIVAGKRDKLALSANYATPRRRMQHLWARVVSDAVRVIAPNLLRSRYTPEEVHQIAVENGKVATDQPGGDSTIDAECEVVEEPEARDAGKATGDQIRRITELFTSMGVPPDKQLAAIRKRGARDLGDLSQEGAVDIIAALEGKLADVDQSSSKSDASATVVETAGPCTEAQIGQAKQLLQAIAQTDGIGIPNRVRAALASKGLKLADLSVTECDELIASLAAKNIEVFFTRTLSGEKEVPKN